MIELLNAREERVRRRQKFMARLVKANHSCLSLTINMPGEEKNSVFTRDLFWEAMRQIKFLLIKKNVELTQEEILFNKAGPTGFLAIKMEALELKKLAVSVEEEYFAGRLCDLDVYNHQNVAISRRELTKPPRKCFICSNQAKICMRRKAHTKCELNAWLAQFEKKFYAQLDVNKAKFIVKIEELAFHAILAEVHLTPKPGLVDAVETGSHDDMDLSTFIRSSNAIKPFFSEFTRAGINSDMEDNTIFSKLRTIGLTAEEAMFSATDGVNTQKGIIFAFGLVTAALGCFYQHPIVVRTEEISQVLLQIVSTWVRGLTIKELVDNPKLVHSHGKEVFERYGVTGARGEAELGYPHVLNVGLPELKKNLKNGLDFSTGALQALIKIISSLDDTNLLYRSDLLTLEEIKKKASSILAMGGLSTPIGRKKVKDLDRFLQARRLSPGGSADLLALTIFLYWVEEFFVLYHFNQS